MKVHAASLSVAIAFFIACSDQTEENEAQMTPENSEQALPVINYPPVFLTVLGNVQDGGSPHPGCAQDCCSDLFTSPDPERMVVSLGLVDQTEEKCWLFEATPNLPRQMKRLLELAGMTTKKTPSGIFLTHAHIGHYAGLMYLGREALDADSVPVFAMPKMRQFLENNGPWNQLIDQKNIEITEITNGSEVRISSSTTVTPFVVPHRDEYSETVGYKIQGPTKSAIFIPDINKWELWEKDIVVEIIYCDYAFLDATFYGEGELKNRTMAEIPHPFVVESMELFATLDSLNRSKVWFIHLNHSNPLLRPDSPESIEIEKLGFHVARYGNIFEL